MIAQDKIDQITARFEFIEAKMSSGASGGQIAELGREYAELKPVVETAAEHARLERVEDLLRDVVVLVRVLGTLGVRLQASPVRVRASSVST